MNTPAFSLIMPNSAPDQFVEFSFKGVTRRMYGGSFFMAPDKNDYLTINLMQEKPELDSSIYFPIRDYSIPQGREALRKVFEEILASDQDVYVGCFGGKGRTGLFMAAFLKYLGNPNPIPTVREQYNSHAVETQEQANYVMNFYSLEAEPSTPASKLKI